jgi:riboflavin kinase/FMN adenylyltransferase
MYKGMMSIGFRPTVDGKNRVVEVNLFDFDRDIYDQQLTVYVHHYLRAEKKFENLQALVEQLHIDKSNSLSLL